MTELSGPIEPTELDRRLDTWRRLEPLVVGLLPFAMLVLCSGISLVLPPETAQTRTALVVLVAVSAVWLTGYRLLLRRLNAFGVGVYIWGLALFGLGLVCVQPWFAFFAAIGYINAIALRSGWRRFVLVLFTAATVSIAQLGGLWNLSSSTLPVYLALVVINTAMVCGFGYYGDLTERQNEQRRRTIDDLAEVNRRLAAALAENAGLHEQLLAQARDAGIAEERRRLAREIHDTLAQGLAGIVTQLEAVGDGLPADTARRLDLARGLARESLVEARRSVSAMQPTGLAGARLSEALVELGSGWQQRTGVPAEVHVTGEPVALPQDAELALYRVAQEALTNVAKHAVASRAVITLSYLDTAVTLDIVDDGTGFDPDVAALRADATGGYGLQTMRQRVAALHGGLQIESSADGTAVGVVLPVGPASSADAARSPGAAPRPDAAPADGTPVGAGLAL